MALGLWEDIGGQTLQQSGADKNNQGKVCSEAIVIGHADFDLRETPLQACRRFGDFQIEQ